LGGSPTGGGRDSQGWDGPGLGSASVTYYIHTVPAAFSLSSADVDAALKDAFTAWSAVLDISFARTAVPGLVDSIDIEFIDIDGNGDILAQAFFPDDVNQNPIAGNIQFDTSEVWETGNSQGSLAFDFLLVAAHEIGHAIGIDHIDNSDAVMNDTASADVAFSGLHPDDIAAGRAIYAAADTADPDPDPDPDTVRRADLNGWGFRLYVRNPDPAISK